MSLPKPIGRQKEVLCLPAQGHFAVLGTAGSGKTTLAILRAAYLADSRTDHYGKTLLVTFNKALVTYLKHIQDRQLLGNVVIENYHTFARGYLAARNKLSDNEILNDSDRREVLVKQAIKLISQRNEAARLRIIGVPENRYKFVIILLLSLRRTLTVFLESRLKLSCNQSR
ncbi:MAG: hypothetical protein PUP91_23290 [Rhizonema sp. PD37]|nr:hypothetical protein [Rhizonema sp. PD37]